MSKLEDKIKEANEILPKLKEQEDQRLKEEQKVAKKLRRQEAFRQKKQQVVEGVEKVKSGTYEALKKFVGTPKKVVDRVLERARQEKEQEALWKAKRQAEHDAYIKQAEERYAEYVKFAAEPHEYPVTYTTENGEKVTVVDTEYGPIFKTIHKVMVDPLLRCIEGEDATYEGIALSSIDPPHLNYCCIREYRYPVTRLKCGASCHDPDMEDIESYEAKKFIGHYRLDDGTYDVLSYSFKRCNYPEMGVSMEIVDRLKADFEKALQLSQETNNPTDGM